MAKLELQFDSKDGIENLVLDEGRYTFGRGSEAEFRFSDDGLSRLHATIYCEDDRVWIVDENSSNGTFVNGSQVGSTGTPISVGDVIKIGHYTNMRVAESAGLVDEELLENESLENETAHAVGAAQEPPSMIVPLSIIGLAFIMIIGAVGIIGAAVYFNGPDEVATDKRRDRYDPLDYEDSPTPTAEDGGNSSGTNGGATPSDTATPGIENGEPTPSGTPYPELPQKQYQQMSESERNLYIKVKAEKVAALIGNKSAGEIPPDAVAAIKRFTDQYAGRFRAGRNDDCTRTFPRSDMRTVLERASKNVPFITRSFRSQAVDPQIGIYVAMIESEHCVCLQSPTGPLGMFQFTKATGESFGLRTKSGASPTNPDERCEPTPASLASAKYLKFLSGRIGTGPLSIPLAIASYNSGEGGLGKNLMTALRAEKGEQRSFWTLVANAEKLSKQFQHENIKYVPKFFAAAIVGENPRDFGAELQPLSTYTK